MIKANQNPNLIRMSRQSKPKFNSTINFRVRFIFGIMSVDGWLVVFSIFLLLQILFADECKKINTCSCKTSSRTIDFRDLVLVNGQPRFSNVADPNDPKTEYFYNPCLRFTIGTCKDATVCQKHHGIDFKLGDVDIKYSGDPDTDTLALQYHFTDIVQTKRTANVKVRCLEGVKGKLTSEGENTKATYNFTLETDIVCRPSNGGGLSTGSILVILFFVFLIIYWLGGFLFLKFVRKAEGNEMVPNYEFWTDFPLLVRDGIFFCVNGCKAESTYEKI